MNAQFPGVTGLKSLDRLRRRRNQAEYPEPESYDPIDRAEVDDAIAVATDCISSARHLLADSALGPY